MRRSAQQVVYNSDPWSKYTFTPPTMEICKVDQTIRTPFQSFPQFGGKDLVHKLLLDHTVRCLTPNTGDSDFNKTILSQQFALVPLTRAAFRTFATAFSWNFRSVVVDDDVEAAPAASDLFRGLKTTQLQSATASGENKVILVCRVVSHRVSAMIREKALGCLALSKSDLAVTIHNVLAVEDDRIVASVDPFKANTMSIRGLMFMFSLEQLPFAQLAEIHKASIVELDLRTSFFWTAQHTKQIFSFDQDHAGDWAD